MTSTYGPDDVQVLRLRAAEGTHLHVLTAGRPGNPLLVLLHGFPECAYAWRRFMAPLAAAGWRVAVPDQRGYGDSDKPEGRAAYRLDRLVDDVLALADRLGAHRFAVAGHDWGGVVAWQLALREPSRITRAVVMNAPCLGTFRRYAAHHPAQWLRSAYVLLFQAPMLPEWLLGWRDCALLRRVLVRTARAGAFSAADLERYAQGWRQRGALTAMLHWYRALPMFAAHAPPTPIAVPVHVIWGDRDPFLEPGLAAAGLALFAFGSELHLPDAGHWLHHEQAPAVLASILTFLAPGLHANA